jgi:hypothetical protein
MLDESTNIFSRNKMIVVDDDFLYIYILVHDVENF